RADRQYFQMVLAVCRKSPAYTGERRSEMTHTSIQVIRGSVVFGVGQNGNATKSISRFCCVLIGVALLTSTARADEVMDWNETLQRAALITGISPLVMNRSAAIVQAAVFDAVNGVDPRYTSIYVKPAAPKG